MATARRPSHLQSQGDILGNLPFHLPPLLNFEFNDNTFFAVYCFIKNFIGVTTCSSPIIDHKIEQAMDLVKNHLMNTWRAEVEILRSRIVELTERIQQLELENNFLRANATPEVLNALYEQQQQQQQLILQKTKDEIASDED
ncbi:protein bunched, class 1/class 3/D/E isoforms-like isoform X1 [Onthophagus taurus]|uniref:protein bunched, class 1/class 3/D/E isoforms-like isoform X1 n=1 Tax=Onthophagus taurus TaxID=166361 RepID=UPI000C20556F|nr:protein bunched, class 1/class 3/D/E isoforms-like isoform X1 [Onthophagus taurus]